VSVLVPDIANPFFAELVKGIEGLAREQDYSVIIGDSGGSIDNERKFLDASVGRTTDGLILVAPRMEDEEIAQANEVVPVVVVDRHLTTASVPEVYVDNKLGAQRAVEHLISQGHNRVGFVGGPENVLNSTRRHDGYLAALSEAGLAYDEKLIHAGSFAFSDGASAGDYFLSLNERPTAVFCSNDLMAIGLIQRARELGFHTPEDISVIGFDDIPFARFVTPALSTVEHPMSEMGLRAMRVLLEQPENRSGSEEKAALRNELVIRGSVAPHRVEAGGRA
jgi:LacI family repressor for deo operon, udp, cdd, tsx, nupC, and nupG